MSFDYLKMTDWFDKNKASKSKVLIIYSQIVFDDYAIQLHFKLKRRVYQENAALIISNKGIKKKPYHNPKSHSIAVQVYFKVGFLVSEL